MQTQKNIVNSSFVFPTKYDIPINGEEMRIKFTVETEQTFWKIREQLKIAGRVDIQQFINGNPVHRYNLWNQNHLRTINCLNNIDDLKNSK